MRNLMPILALVIAAGIFWGYVNPTYTGAIAQAEAAIKNDNQALTAASAYTAKENQLAAARDQIPADDLARLEKLLPNSVNNVQSILDLNALASRSGLAISAINVVSSPTSGATNAQGLPSSASGPTGSVDLSLAATGTYSAFRSFLLGVESSERLLDVSQLSVKGSESGVYSYQISLRLYWLK